MSENIYKFLAERKEAWIKKNINNAMSEQQKNELLQEGELKYSLEQWLPDAAKRARQLAMVSHPGKFSHPNAKISPFITQIPFLEDGYLRSGNADYELDVLGNAAALDVHKFLNILMSDGRTVLNHIEIDSLEIKSAFNIATATYDQLKQNFMAIKQNTQQEEIYTDALIKQVYFPIADNYHLLSILTPSGLVSRLKKQIDEMRFSEATKAAKDFCKDNKYHADGYDDIYDLTVIGYGGTQPQNISVLNTQNAGRAYLLSCLPPTLQKRHIRLPRYSFFKNTLWNGEFKLKFQMLHTLFQSDIKNQKTRNKIEYVLRAIIDRVLEKAISLRDIYEAHWSDGDIYHNLPESQKIWLDNAYQSQRENEEEWIKDIIKAFSYWVLKTYEGIYKNQAFMLGDAEFREVKELIKDTIKADREFFK